jgi:hypothetical protein
MKQYRYALVLVLASVLGAWTWTAAARADDVPLTAEEKEELAALRKQEMHDTQMKGLFACIAGVCFVSLLFWTLSRYNTVRKQKTEQERKEWVPDDGIPTSYSPQPGPYPSEPPASDW